MHPADALKSLIEGGEIVMAPGAPDPLTARLIQQAGFPAVYMTGFGATASHLGVPDLGLMTLTEMTTHARNMTRVVSIPIIADADTGYGGPANIERTVHEYLQAGVAAIHLEDQQQPKRCGQLSGIKLIDADENVRRLRCAVAARGLAKLLVIARTDALPVFGAQEAIRRANLYRDAGVDLVFVDGIKTIHEIETVARHVEGPKVVSIVDGNETTELTAAELGQMGFQVVFYAVSTLFSAVKAVQDTLSVLKREGTAKARQPAMVTYQEYSQCVGLREFQSLDDRFG
ncbi:MAG: isocitrate lyase/PEP mutase family protein [Alphaproteobacteria bacterium]|jgi:2-methylisocitrate lyase-like PEP mutase family enzyme|nr:isocitrate lyase/PEP mutase family protein [Alphaproteobacteria bacterium]MBU1551378.1 isocitrate lyase/PEP mutase family protein [Alphaproteobacteria bacterium]MBU2336523.1 isocitrate lyase/PEP mutase family protein [Alphaproteobacteria bacterium]MBU2387937.1 isocitrate lyase/PEP mutase family protein [Alphaproteobacteria bacterium]